MNKKYELNATDEQLEKLYKSLHVGSPLNIALSFAGIPLSLYKYWVEIASVVAYCKEQDFIKKQDEDVKSGVSYADIREEVLESSATYRTSINAMKEPKGEAILRYRNNRTYQEFANKIYDIIQKCDQMRSEIVMYHLTAIRDSARQKGTNSNASQWFLEHTMPEYFGKAERTETKTETKTAKISIEYIDPEKKENKDRLKQMEQLVEQELLNGKEA